MRTTVTLDEELVRRVQALYGSKTKTAAVTQALHEHIRLARLNELAGLLGKVDFDEDAIRSGDEADLDRAARLAAVEDGDES